MEITLFSVLALGFILGIRHAMEPDHMIAVSTIPARVKNYGKHRWRVFFGESGIQSHFLSLGLFSF